MPIQQTLFHSEEENIRSLINKVKIFNHHVGDYQLHRYTDPFHCFIQLTNGTIFFTVNELQANKNQQLDLEMMVTITGRFEPSMKNDRKRTS